MSKNKKETQSNKGKGAAIARSLLEDQDPLDEEVRPGRKRLYGRYEAIPKVGKPVIVKDKESGTKQVIMMTHDGHLKCCGVVRKIGPDMYYWQGLAGQDGRKKTEWEAFLALGYKYISDQDIEIIKPRLDPKPIEQSNPMVVQSTIGPCAVDSRLNVLTVGSKVTVTRKEAYNDKQLKGLIGVVIKINSQELKNCLVFFDASTECCIQSKCLELVEITNVV